MGFPCKTCIKDCILLIKLSGDEMKQHYIENTEYEILTPDGWRDFNGITITLNKITFTVSLANGDLVSATGNHYFFSNNEKIQLKNLQIGQTIDTVSGPLEIISINENIPTSVYDIIEVDQLDHKFIVKEMLSCKFPFINVPLTVESAIGTNWYELKEIGTYSSDKLSA